MIAAIAKFVGVPGWAVIAALVALAVLGGGLGKCAYDHGVISRHETKQENKQLRRERTADTNLGEQKAKDDAGQQRRQQEIDNATRNIPDQAPSARQRARACVELRRQAQERRQPQPAC